MMKSMTSQEELKKYTILIVDDEEDLRETVAFDFQRKGFTVLTAESAEKGFEIVKKTKVDLVISDMKMPGGNGVSLLEKIRIQNAAVPIVIFMTGFSDVSEEECIKKGATQVVTKPFERSVLMKAVMNSLKIS